MKMPHRQPLCCRVLFVTVFFALKMYWFSSPRGGSIQLSPESAFSSPSQATSPEGSTDSLLLVSLGFLTCYCTNIYKVTNNVQ